VKKKGKILLVDDNEEILLSLEILLEKYFIITKTVNNPERIPFLLKNGDFDVIVLDMNYTASVKSGNEGLYWLKEILKADLSISVIFITAYPGLELAVKAIKQGATDFIEKPWNNEKLIATVLNAVELRFSKNEIKQLKEKQHSINSYELIYDMVKGESMIMQKVYSVIEKVAATEASILIYGENGTGKELIAREVHRLSDRNNKPFVKLDVGAFPESLFESELFGFEAGAFTDAQQTKAGRLEVASDGTLFLDEIGNLSYKLQSKLLTVIQEKTFSRLGSNKQRFVDFRLVCATNRSLAEMVQKGEFREDLLYRLNTIQIELPPLRQRITDIPNLVNFFVEKLKKKYIKPSLKLSDNAMNKLINYHWPGNIRQLEHVVENSIIMAEKNIITQNDINIQMNDNSAYNARQNYYENEKCFVESTLRDCNGNLSMAAKKLGIARTTLYRKIKKYDI
jgi:DNA-binding NtrC family response regulator